LITEPFLRYTFLATLLATLPQQIGQADWTLLDAIIPTGPSGGFGDFMEVGPINISCLEGMMHFGFFYQGSDPSATTRYHLDDFEVTGM